MPSQQVDRIMVERRAPRAGRVDQAQMRAANMGLILRHLRTHGGKSRARLAAETGLSKATMSSLVSDLAERGLVEEGGLDRDGSVGRPGQIVSVTGASVAGVGLEISVDHLAVTGVDLRGTVIRESSVSLPVDQLPQEVVLDQMANLMARTLDSIRGAGMRVVAVTVAPPGVVDYGAGSVRFAPNLGWRSVPVVAELSRRLGPSAPPIHLENDAKLAAMAAYAGHAHEGIRDLLYLTGDAGVGAGIIAGGRLVRGWSGFSGEVGHLPLDPDQHPCNCGRTGCWETVIGLAALLRLAAPDDDVVHDPDRPIEDRLQTIRQRAVDGDARTVAALDTITGHLARGLSLLIDVLNPEVVVLGGYFGFFGDQVLPPLDEALARRRMDEGSRVRLAVNPQHVGAASRGGALVALEDVFDDPTIVSGLEQPA